MKERLQQQAGDLSDDLTRLPHTVDRHPDRITVTTTERGKQQPNCPSDRCARPCPYSRGLRLEVVGEEAVLVVKAAISQRAGTCQKTKVAYGEGAIYNRGVARPQDTEEGVPDTRTDDRNTDKKMPAFDGPMTSEEHLLRERRDVGLLHDPVQEVDVLPGEAVAKGLDCGVVRPDSEIADRADNDFLLIRGLILRAAVPSCFARAPTGGPRARRACLKADSVEEVEATRRGRSRRAPEEQRRVLDSGIDSADVALPIVATSELGEIPPFPREAMDDPKAVHEGSERANAVQVCTLPPPEARSFGGEADDIRGRMHPGAAIGCLKLPPVVFICLLRQPSRLALQ
mmetsp:Transcript_78383/g.227501  ORF Transcript_78383/g.227501 Transcript_78383/m.227501 type:complete len:343 (-) Transcript_78383:78-1106(-)